MLASRKRFFNDACKLDIIDDIDMEKICRTCLRQDDNMRPVFNKDPSEHLPSSLSSMVSYCTQLKITESDDLPLHICYDCFDNVKRAFAFKLQAEQADAKLRNYIAHKQFKSLLPANTSIKEEDSRGSSGDLVTVKTEMKLADNYENNFDDDYDIRSFNQESDYSDEDFKPLKELKNTSAKKLANTEVSKKNSEKSVPCQFCSKIFLNDVQLENHKQKFHSGFVQCNLCSRAFTKPCYLERHKTSAHPGSTEKQNEKQKSNSSVTCTLCGFTFSGEDQLISHISLSHNSGPRKRGRPSKKDIMLNKMKLKKILHSMNIKMENPNYEAKTSEEYFNDTHGDSPESVDKIDIYEEPKEHTSSYCKICDKTYSNIEDLRVHLTSHNSENSFENIDIRSKIGLLENHEKLYQLNLSTMSDSDIKNIIINDIIDQKFDSYIGELKLEPGDNVSDSENSCIPKEEVNNKKLKMYIDKSKIKQGILKLRKYKMHKCSLCNQSFSRSNHIMRHMSTHNFEYPDKCDICNKVFPNEDLLSKHKKTQCENTSKNYQCGGCNLKFMHEMSLNKHILKNHKGQAVSVNFLDPVYQKKEKSFTCTTCNRSFYRKDHLDNHVKIHLPNEKKFECPICQKKFNRKDNLRSHSRVHETNKNELESNCLCVYCGRSFSNSSNLIVHIRRHTGEKPYKCDVCDKGFPRSSDLQCHKRTHTGEKPCLCTICGKGFSRSNKLVRHMRIHTGHRPYKCSFCDRAFTQSNDLTLHVRRHTGDKPYVCGVCGDRFIQGTALHAHRRMQGHFEPNNQTPPIPANSVNNTNRCLINRVIAVKTDSKPEIQQPVATSSTNQPNNLLTPHANTVFYML